MQAILVGYGTLLSNASLVRTLGERAVEAKRFVPVVIEGFRRLYDLRPPMYEPSRVLGLEAQEAAAANIEPAPGERFNALAFAATLEEVDRLDEREYEYERIVVELASFESGRPFGRAFAYSSRPDAPWIERDPRRLLPRWRDVELARGGAYAVGRSFGELFDRTTYLADGRTLLAEFLRARLPAEFAALERPSA